MAAYRDLAASWLDAKRAQVDALNDAGFSLEEYRWVRSEVYRALDIPFVEVDFSRIAAQARNGGVPEGVRVGGAFSGPGADANKKLVERYRKLLEDNMPMAAFGL